MYLLCSVHLCSRTPLGIQNQIDKVRVTILVGRKHLSVLWMQNTPENYFLRIIESSYQSTFILPPET